MSGFTPCTLRMGEEGDPSVFFQKVTGYGYNDMISLPTLTKDSILENLKRRFKVTCLTNKSRALPPLLPSLGPKIASI